MKSFENSTTPEWVDPDDAPDWTEEVFERAQLSENGKILRRATGTLTKRGRPRLAKPKRQVTLRLDSDVIDRFRESGPGWQSRINEILKKAADV